MARCAGGALAAYVLSSGGGEKMVLVARAVSRAASSTASRAAATARGAVRVAK